MLVNLSCHMLFSVPASFFTQEAERHNMSGDQIGFHFALFAMTVFVVAPFATNWMSRNGALHTYRRGLCIISVATICFAPAALFTSDMLFVPWTNTMRMLQGVGAALEEASAYVLIFNIAPLERVSLFTGMVEVSTGLGYMLGAPLGGLLFSAGGFAAPFCLLGSALLLGLPVLRFLSVREHKREADADGGSTAPPRNIRGLLRLHPSIGLLALACVLANSDYALLEPTLGDYAIAEGVVGIEGAAAEIGLLFLVASFAYTIVCPLAGWLSGVTRRPFTVIGCGLLLQAIGLLLLAPTTGLAEAVREEFPERLQSPSTLARMRIALLLLGTGDALSMTPMLEAMMWTTCSEGNADHPWTEVLGGLLSAAFALGQILGPIVGASITARVGFPVACTLHATVLIVCALAVAILAAHLHGRQRSRPRAAPLPVAEQEMREAGDAANEWNERVGGDGDVSAREHPRSLLTQGGRNSSDADECESAMETHEVRFGMLAECCTIEIKRVHTSAAS